MTYRNILVEVDDTAAGKLRIAAAASLAARLKSAMTGVFLKAELLPSYLLGDGLAVLPAENVDLFLQDRREETAKALSAARAVFDAAARDANIPFFWLEANGDTNDQLVTCARRHDLAILPASMKPPFGAAAISATSVAMASGGPVLITPRGGYKSDFGKRVLVLWKDSRESARALHDAWPILSTAQEAHFLTVSAGEEPGLDALLQRHVERHDCRIVKHVVDHIDDGSTPATIRRHIEMLGADLVVMGLYGHSRLREFVFGGVSRELLAALPTPLLISH